MNSKWSNKRLKLELIPNVRAKTLWPMHRCLGVSYARLLLGSTNLNDNLHKMKFTDTPNCECNEARETIPHFLMECSLYKESRISMMNTIGRRWMENRKSEVRNS